jgi:general secretion pathway protein A
VQSFLVGQPEFRGILQRPEMSQLKQRVIASYHLGPLDVEETRAYIEHRLRHVGWSDNPHFDAAAFAQIHAGSGGVPRRINTLCDRLLLAAYLGDKRLIGAADVETVAAEMELELGGPDEADPHSVETRVETSGPQLVNNTASVNSGAQISRLPSAVERSLQEQVAKLEERVALLESSNGMMFNLIRKVLRILRGNQDYSTASTIGR